MSGKQQQLIVNGNKTVNLDFVCRQWLVNNNTPNWVYIRIGGTDSPGPTNCDFAIPPYTIQAYPIEARIFAFSISQAAPNTSLATRCIVYFFEYAEEAAIGNIDLMGLASADEVLGYPVNVEDVSSGQTVVGSWVDLKSWSGAYIYCSSSRLFNLSIGLSDDGVNAVDVLDNRSGSFVSGYIPRARRYFRPSVTMQPNIPSGVDLRLNVTRTIETVDYGLKQSTPYLIGVSLGSGSEDVYLPFNRPFERIMIRHAANPATYNVTIEASNEGGVTFSLPGGTARLIKDMAVNIAAVRKVTFAYVSGSPTGSTQIVAMVADNSLPALQV